MLPMPDDDTFRAPRKEIRLKRFGYAPEGPV